MAETVKVTKWGNSLGVRIPQHIAQKFDIYAGKRLRVSYLGGDIILRVEPTERELVEEWLRYTEAHGLHPDD
jgi:antitoxin MazE